MISEGGDGGDSPQACHHSLLIPPVSSTINLNPGLWCQVDTVFCASLVLTKVVVQVESDRLDEVNSHLMYLEQKQAACYLALIGTTPLWLTSTRTSTLISPTDGTLTG